MWFWLIIWIAILIFNAINSFLPKKLQGRKCIRATAMIVASLILIRGVYQEIDTIRNRSYAYISPDGQIIKSNNFPWKITHVERSEVGIYYIINKRGDGSAITVTPDDSTCEPNVRGAMAGVLIQFDCMPSKEFKVDVKR